MGEEGGRGRWSWNDRWTNNKKMLSSEQKKRDITEKTTPTLLFCLKDFLNWLMILFNTNYPTCGNFVLIIATSAAKKGVKGKLAAWVFIILLANKPLPRMRFSENSSSTICLILVMLTRFTIHIQALSPLSCVKLFHVSFTNGKFLSILPQRSSSFKTMQKSPGIAGFDLSEAHPGNLVVYHTHYKCPAICHLRTCKPEVIMNR